MPLLVKTPTSCALRLLTEDDADALTRIPANIMELNEHGLRQHRPGAAPPLGCSTWTVLPESSVV